MTEARFYPSDTPPFANEPTRERFDIAPQSAGVGEGVVTRVPFRAGEEVLAFTGQVVDERTLYSLQLPDGRHLHDPWFMGKVLHHCDPNCTVDMERRVFIARRDIATGERITMDYHETEDVLFRGFTCRCGAPNCRGRVTGRRAVERAIDVRGVGRRFGLRWVLRGVTLDVRRGEAVGLLGANGSGKSTVLRIIATLLRPNAGTASVDGLDVVRDAGGVRTRVGYLAHTPGLYDDLTARENLIFAADMMGLPRESVDAILDLVGLAHVADDRVRGFSAGMQRRLALARLVMRRPSVLVLDEPYSNLDADGVKLMNSTIAGVVGAGGAALLALHEVAPARDLLSRTLTIAEGRIAGADVEQPARHRRSALAAGGR